MAKAGSILGNAVVRLEDPTLVTGAGQYVDDLEAVDAAGAVVVDIDPLPAVVSQDAALAPDAPLLFPDHGTNVCFGTAIGAEEDPLVGADVVAEVSMVSQRLAGVPMEPNGCLMVP